MEKLLKFNQRAEKLDDNTDNVSFGIIIQLNDNNSYFFKMVNDKGEPIKFINFNEWKISSITSSNYFDRKKIHMMYRDPENSTETIETGGSTTHCIEHMEDLLCRVLSHFYRISFFESIPNVINKRKQFELIGDKYEAMDLNHKFMSTCL